MGITTGTLPNRNYQPTDLESDILAVLKEGRDEGEPWGYANNRRLVRRTGVRRQYIQRALDNLTAAGWVEKTDRALYRLVEDPRDE